MTFQQAYIQALQELLGFSQQEACATAASDAETFGVPLDEEMTTDEAFELRQGIAMGISGFVSGQVPAGANGPFVLVRPPRGN
jgi:hypothetical protein